MNINRQTHAVITSILIILAYSTTRVGAAGIELPEKSGLAAAYPGDVGIKKNPAVVFAENFEEGTLQELIHRWTDASNKDAKILAFSTDVPAESAGKRSLQMTATRGHDSGGHLFKVISPGQDRLFVRFYTRFAPDYGFCHHFVRIRAMIDPSPYPLGQISKQPSHRWCGTDIEPLRVSQFGGLAMPTSPPGVWALSSYWPDMRSWQGPGGTSFYPDLFEPQKRVAVARGRWICVEVMVKMNSSPDKSDGAQAAWIDGKLVSYLGPRTVSGYWRRDKYILDDEKGEPFEGFRWRKDVPLKWNRLWLLHYVSERNFKKSDAYAAEHPDAPINTQTAAVWFDDIVVATEYIGPSGGIEPRQRPNKGHVKALNAKPKRPTGPAPW